MVEILPILEIDEDSFTIVWEIGSKSVSLVINPKDAKLVSSPFNEEIGPEKVRMGNGFETYVQIAEFFERVIDHGMAKKEQTEEGSKKNRLEETQSLPQEKESALGFLNLIQISPDCFSEDNILSVEGILKTEERLEEAGADFTGCFWRGGINPGLLIQTEFGEKLVKPGDWVVVDSSGKIHLVLKRSAD